MSANSPHLIPYLALKERRFDEAERQINDELSRFPYDKDFLTLLGILKCYRQREDLAVELLEKGSGSRYSDELASLLVNYYHCRAKMVKKLGAKDATLNSIQQRLKPFQSFLNPQVGIGISACLIVKNEEEHLPNCLRALKDRVDQIVVVDTGSTDSTISIAKEYGATLGNFDWVSDFSAARNASLELAKYPWILWIDADEVVDSTSWKSIYEGVTRPQFGGYFLPITNYIDEQHNGVYSHSPVRIFQNHAEIRFEGRIHEQITPSIEKLGLPCATLENAKIHHYGYTPSMMEQRNKAARTIQMLEREVREKPTDAFHWFNLANAYSVDQQHDKAIHASKMSLKFIEPGNNFGTNTFQIMCSSMIAVGAWEDALKQALEARKRGFFTLLNQFEEAHALYHAEQFEQALYAIEQVIGQEWPIELTGDRGIVGFKGLTLKGKILNALQRYEEAKVCLDESLKSDPEFALTQFQKARTHYALNEFEEALIWAKKAEVQPGYEAWSLSLIGDCYEKMARLPEAAQVFERAWLLRPDVTNNWVKWVTNCENRGDANSLVRAYEEFSKRNEPTTEILINWGRALAMTNQPQKAIDCLMEAIKREPESPNAYFNLGDLLYAYQHFADAAQLYETGLRLEPTHAEGWFVLGNCLAQLNLVPGASLAYQKTLELAPSHSQAQHNLAIINAPEETSKAA